MPIRTPDETLHPVFSPSGCGFRGLIRVMPNITCLLYLSATDTDRPTHLPRRWFRVACVSYDPDYETYFDRLGRKQCYPELRTLRSAMRYAMREARTIEGMGLPARIWGPLPRHADSGHIHIAVLAARSGQVKSGRPRDS